MDGFLSLHRALAGWKLRRLWLQIQPAPPCQRVDTINITAWLPSLHHDTTTIIILIARARDCSKTVLGAIDPLSVLTQIQIISALPYGPTATDSPKSGMTISISSLAHCSWFRQESATRGMLPELKIAIPTKTHVRSHEYRRRLLTCSMTPQSKARSLRTPHDNEALKSFCGLSTQHVAIPDHLSELA